MGGCQEESLAPHTTEVERTARQDASAPMSKLHQAPLNLAVLDEEFDFTILTITFLISIPRNPPFQPVHGQTQGRPAREAVAAAEYRKRERFWIRLGGRWQVSLSLWQD
jgi:hypothetical protein